MASLTGMNLYICANVLLVLAAALLGGLRAASARLRRPIAYRHQLRLGQIMAVAGILLPAVSLLSDHDSFLPQTAQVWSAPAMQNGAVSALPDHRITVSFASSNASLPLSFVGQAAVALFLIGLFVLLARVAMDAAATMRIITSAQTIRRHGRLKILASERIQVPFSFWLPTRYFIVMPSALLLRCDDLRIAIRHEAQHHRQQDTKWLYFYSLLKASFFWNPAVHRLGKQLSELQEFACDEALSDQRRVSAQDYCQCLLRVAEAATRSSHALIHAGMTGGSAGKILKLRIQVLLMRPSAHLHRSAVLITSVAALTLMTATALAFASTIHDRRISAEEANRMAAVARQGSAFPIVMNDRVLQQLNLLLSTPDGRAFLQASLERMQSHEAFVKSQLEQHGLPLELLAVPLVESGYRNLPQSGNPRHGAGLWMFIAPTAKRFGLTVNADRDERLDVAAETGAAVRMFASLYEHFGDWGLALLAYNAGSAQVESAIRQTGSRDVWEITSRGFENDRDYVVRVMAAILVIRNPAVLERH
jgi:membrane-bound lytic murein transglycosylase D